MNVSDAVRLEDHVDENRRLKQFVADQPLKLWADVNNVSLYFTRRGKPTVKPHVE